MTVIADYKKLYFSLFNEVTDAIERLKLAQQLAEDEYIHDEEPISIDGLLPTDQKE